MIDRQHVLDIVRDPAVAHRAGQGTTAMHSLLLRQLRRFFGSVDNVPSELAGFLELIDQTYCSADADRKLIEHSLDLVSSELIERNRKLQEELSERLRAEERLHLWARVFESSRDGIFITNARREIIAVNQAFVQITGFSPDEVIGRQPEIFSRETVGLDASEAIWTTVDTVSHWQGEILDRRRNGEAYPTWTTLTAARNGEGLVMNYIAIFSDISDRKAAEEQIHWLAYHDFLTGLPNRNLLEDRLTQAIAHARRMENQVAILFLDLDRFKTINDSLGHQVGDMLLRLVAKRLQGCVRSDDTVCRLGGDEFIIVLTDVMKARHAAALARKIGMAIAEPCLIQGVEFHATASIGISLYPGDGQDVDTLIKNADAAMYVAKESGRDSFQFFASEMNARALERLSLENSLRRAIEREELVLHYQPQVDLATGRIVAVEALVRWQHPDLGLLSPLKFIPVAEDTGLIVPLGEWVLRTACRTVRDWHAKGFGTIAMAVNLSARQFRQQDLPQLVGRVIAETGIDPGFLELELTETMVMQDAEAAIVALKELNALGVSIAIDDFGTGYSSLAYLKRFPIDKLKVDKSFVHDITIDPDDAAIASAIISLAHNLKLQVLAEGVETQAQLSFLRERGCHQAQGYLFSRPVPKADAEVLLLARLQAGQVGVP